MTVGEIVYRIEGDDQGINRAFGRVRQGAADTAQNVNRLEQSANNAGSAAELSAEAVNQLLSAINNMSSSVTSSLNDVSGSLVNIETSTADAANSLRDINSQMDSLGQSAGNAESKIGKVCEALAKAASTLLKIGAAAVTAAASGISALSVKAVECYADYEQLTGGVETLFKTSADTVMQYANEAYKTAGLSANQYMETVTGFSASLISSLGGDTEAAAELANQAIVDMADNANKMGTDIASIQNAYQGFAKQNYTMLDNLKLGYGGTKEEMSRLLEDAEKISGVHYDISSFADITEAIHVMQVEWGITGTTSKEAATTIQGSIGAMKAAWENMLTGMSDPSQDFGALVQNFIDSLLTVEQNLMPRISEILPQMAQAINQLGENLLPELPKLFESLVPDVLEGANILIQSLLDALSEGVDTALPVIEDFLPQISDTFIGGISDILPAVAGAAVTLIAALAESILSEENISAITQAAVDTVIALVDGLVECLPTLIPVAVQAVITLAEGLIDNIPAIINAAIALIEALVEGVMGAVPLLLQQAPVIIEKLCVALLDVVPDLNARVSEAIAKGIVNGLVNFDWSEGAQNAIAALDDAMMAAAESQSRKQGYAILGSQEEAERRLQEALDEMREANGGELVRGFEGIDEFLNGRAESISTASLMAEEAAKRQMAALDKLKKAKVQVNSAESKDILTGDALKSAVKDIDNQYALGNYDSEKAYWADRLALLEANRNEEDQAWIDFYGKTREHYEKAVENEEKAAKKAADDAAKAIANAEREKQQKAKEEETALKNSVKDKFRDLETEQLEKGYSDSWLMEQERAFIETLDHNSDVYKEYNLKLLKEQDKTDKAAEKEAEKSAEKQKKALEKVYNDVIKSRDKLASDLDSGGGLFKTSEKEETDKRTGEKSKNKDRKIGFEEFEKKIAAKKQLSSKIAELYEKGTPDELVRQLIKQDPEDALYYANELLKNPAKLKKLSAGLTEDDAISKDIANMVTEHSDDFKELGTEAGNTFGEEFIAAFKENWETAFSDEYTVNAAAKVSAANSSAAATTTVRQDTSANRTDASASRRTTLPTSGTDKYKIVDLNGTYIATVVRTAEQSRKTISGGN